MTSNNNVLVVHNFTDVPPAVGASSTESPTPDNTVEFSTKHVVLFNDEQVEVEHRYTVSKDIVRPASKIWNRLLQDTHEPRIQLHNTDPESLRIIFSMLHRQRNGIPESVSLEQLVQIVNLSENFKTIGAIRQHLNFYASPYRDDGAFMQPGNEMFICVAYQLGYHANFHAMAEYWQMNGSIGDDGVFVLPSGTRLSADDEWMPQGLLKEILQTREDNIQDILDHVYEKITELDLVRKCVKGDHLSKECDAQAIDSVEAAFSKAPINLYEGKMKNAIDIKCTLAEFWKALRDIKVPFLQDVMVDIIGHEKIAVDHAECGQEEQFHLIIEEAIDRLESPVTSAHRRHLSVQLREGVAAARVRSLGFFMPPSH